MKPHGRAVEVLRAFLWLGISSFGGPVAHLGYFRREFVERRKWLAEDDYAALLALCQFLPGPASSQTGFCIGLQRAGFLGGLAAWAGFTLPSAIAMFFFAGFADFFQHHRAVGQSLHGLQLAAVAVVAQAVWVMAVTLCPDARRRVVAVLAAILAVQFSGAGGQIAVLLLGAAAGRFLVPQAPPMPAAALDAYISQRAAFICLSGFFVLLAISLIGLPAGAGALFAAFYRTGALVFGGGHVVLPLLREAVVIPGWVSPAQFLTGYGAAQAMPGPLFTVAAYLGAVSSNGAGALEGASLAIAGIFLPGLLLVAGIMPYWAHIRRNGILAASLAGVNAAVVGLLAAALLNLIALGGIDSPGDVLIVVVALLALTLYKMPPIIVIAFCALAAMIA